jgi:hypothetical protein
MTGSTELPALQRTLAAEHAAVYVLGVLGGRAAVLGPSPLRPALEAAYDAHVTRRDTLRTLVTGAGGDPVAAEPAYDLPRNLATPGQITAEALRVERTTCATYAAQVAGTSGAARTWAVTALREGALSELTFGGPPRPLPGLPAGYARRRAAGS